MRLRFQHKDGLTHVFNAETGEKIENCTKLVFVHDPQGDGIRCDLTITDYGPEFEIEAGADMKTIDATTLEDVSRKLKNVKFREFT